MIVRGYFDNTGRIVRLIFRRERVFSALWLAGLVLFSVSLASGIADMFDPPARVALAETLKNPGMIALMGPVYGADNYTIGAMYSNTMFIWVAITVAAMNILLIIRHTRADEEDGRAEVVRSLPTGRLAILNAAMFTALIVNAILAILTGLGVAAMQTESMGFAASMLYGAALGAFGLFFAAVAALFAQLSASSRSATVYSFITLCVVFVIRAAGDVSSEALSLLSPLGLIQRSQLFVENKVWPVIILLVEAAAVSAAAYALNAIRDLDQGFISARPGKPGASSLLRTSSGLAFRLLRNSIIGWFVIMFCLGASYGTILADIEMFVAESEFYQMVISANNDFSTLEMFTATVNVIASLVAIVPLLTITLRPRVEEREGRAEAVLARPVSREKYLAGYVIPALGASVLLPIASALGLYASSAAVLEEPISLSFLLEANLVFVPALWVMIGAAVLLIGVLPKYTGVIWAYFGFSFFTEFIGRMLDLPGWLGKLTPLGYIPVLPVEQTNLTTLCLVGAVGLLLILAGTFFYERRDLVG